MLSDIYYYWNHTLHSGVCYHANPSEQMIRRPYWLYHDISIRFNSRDKATIQEALNIEIMPMAAVRYESKTMDFVPMLEIIRKLDHGEILFKGANKYFTLCPVRFDILRVSSPSKAVLWANMRAREIDKKEIEP